MNEILGRINQNKFQTQTNNDLLPPASPIHISASTFSLVPLPTSIFAFSLLLVPSFFHSPSPLPLQVQFHLSLHAHMSPSESTYPFSRVGGNCAQNIFQTNSAPSIDDYLSGGQTTHRHWERNIEVWGALGEEGFLDALLRFRDKEVIMDDVYLCEIVEIAIATRGLFLAKSRGRCTEYESTYADARLLNEC